MTDADIKTGSHPGEVSQLYRTLALLLLAGFLVLLLVGLGAFPLQDPDEGRYADVAAAMVRTGDWITPRLNGLEYFSKPPLFYWLSATSMSVFGINEGAARLPTALASALTVLLVLVLGWRGFGPKVGLLSGLVYASMPLIIGFSRVVMVDPTLSFFITLSLYFGYEAYVRNEGPPRKSTVVGFWVALAFGVLVKGPFVTAIPLAGILSFLVLKGEWRRILSLLQWRGLLLASLIAAPWFLAVWREHPSFLYDFFVRTNVERAVSGGPFRREGAIWYYVPVLVFGLFPWCLVFIPALVSGARLRKSTDPSGRMRFYLSCCVLFPLGLLSVAQSKLAYYVLPLCPALALLAGERIIVGATKRVWARRLSWGALALVVLFAVLAFILLAMPERVDRWSRGDANEVRILAAVFMALFALGLGITWRCLARERPVRAAIVCASTLLLGSAFIPWGAARIGPLYSTGEMAATIDEHLQESEGLVCFGRFYRGVSFYRQDNMVLWDPRLGEFGKMPEGPLALMEEPRRLLELWKSKPSLLFFAQDDDLEAIGSILGAPLVVVHAARRYILARCENPAWKG